MDAAAPTAAAVQSSVSGACLSCHDGSIAIDVLTNLRGAANLARIAFTRQATSKATYGTGGTGQNNILTGGSPFLGNDLRNDHPITIIYETSRAATPLEFVTQTITGTKITVGSTNPLPLYGAATATATIECASCHNPHNNVNGGFLRKSNAGSAMCLTCHIK
jgi:predicted CXXCH cytochrome family protein